MPTKFLESLTWGGVALQHVSNGAAVCIRAHLDFDRHGVCNGEGASEVCCAGVFLGFESPQQVQGVTYMTSVVLDFPQDPVQQASVGLLCSRKLCIILGNIY